MKKLDTKDFKELEIILSDFACDKHCPYCTAKITKWDNQEDNIDLLGANVGQMKELGYTFHYVTIGGNGEPTLHSYNKLKAIVDMFDDWDIPVKRVLTSGNVFRSNMSDVYNLFVEHNWMFEVTVTSMYYEDDSFTLGYNHDYFNTQAFNNARIRLNYVLLKKNKNTWTREIREISKAHPNIETLALKLLNINTKTGLVDNPFSAWIQENAIPKTDREKIVDQLNYEFIYIGERYDTHSWIMENGTEVYFSWKKLTYGQFDLVWYGDKFVSYQLEEISLSHLVPKTYIAARFIKDKTDSGASFARDFRVDLIGDEEKFVNANDTSFVHNDAGEKILQYIGPFYNEKASTGEFTSTDCEKVVDTENRLIENCDLFIAYFDETLSPGGITELIYAAMLNKRIIIFFKEEDDISYSLKSSNWYPITFVLGKVDKCSVYKVSSEQDIRGILNKINL